MIGIVDYAVGNTGSLRNTLDYLEIPSMLSGDPSELSRCQGIILPGVGAFSPAMERLNNLGLSTFLIDWAGSGRSLLGICLGMQLLLSGSEENGPTAGLDIIPGKVVKIRHASRTTHIGWNMINPVKTNNIVRKTGYGYFVHSYACIMDSDQSVIGETQYGISFASVINTGRVTGVQFHPEKSQRFGLSILKGFANGEF